MTDDEGQGLFDFEESQNEKREGMERAAANRPYLLEMARSAALYLGRNGGVVTADMVQDYLMHSIEGYRTAHLGNAAGSIFKGEEWVPVGHYTSSRVINHGAEQKTWMLRKFFDLSRLQ